MLVHDVATSVFWHNLVQLSTAVEHVMLFLRRPALDVSEFPILESVGSLFMNLEFGVLEFFRSLFTNFEISILECVGSLFANLDFSLLHTVDSFVINFESSRLELVDTLLRISVLTISQLVIHNFFGASNDFFCRLL